MSSKKVSPLPATQKCKTVCHKIVYQVLALEEHQITAEDASPQASGKR
jgi:hypothetical protein